VSSGKGPEDVMGSLVVIKRERVWEDEGDETETNDGTSDPGERRRNRVGGG